MRDGLSALAGLGFELHGDAGDFDRRLRRTHLQRQVDALPVAHRDGDVLGGGVGKARRAGLDRVNAHAHRRHFIVARSARSLPSTTLFVAVFVTTTVAPLNRGAGAVMNRPDHASILVLGKAVSAGENRAAPQRSKCSLETCRRKRLKA